MGHEASKGSASQIHSIHALSTQSRGHMTLGLLKRMHVPACNIPMQSCPCSAPAAAAPSPTGVSVSAASPSITPENQFFTASQSSLLMSSPACGHVSMCVVCAGQLVPQMFVSVLGHVLLLLLLFFWLGDCMYMYPLHHSCRLGMLLGLYLGLLACLQSKRQCDVQSRQRRRKRIRGF